MSDDLIPSYILNLRSVHLTKAGQAAVSAFRPEILALADSKLLRYKGSLRNRVGYFLKLCHELSREKSLLPDYDYAAYLHKQLGTDDTMQLMVRNAPAPQTLLRQGFVGQAQKRDQAALSPHPQSTIAPGGTPPSLPSPVLRSLGEVGRVLLSDQETEQRRAAFMNDPQVIAGIDKLAMLMGHEHASKYFARVFDNLKIKEL